MRSNHAALVDDSDEEECNRVGSVFAKFLCVSRRDAVSVAEVVVLSQRAMVVCTMARKKSTKKNPSKYSDPNEQGFFIVAEHRGGTEYEGVRYPIRAAGPAGMNLTNASGLRSQAEARYEEVAGRYRVRPVAPGESQVGKGNAGKRVAKYKGRGGAGGTKKK
jgi:hypothetical protein